MFCEEQFKLLVTENYDIPSSLLYIHKSSREK